MTTPNLQTLRRCFILAAGFAAASLLNAQATRTWVSGVGDDVNPCSRTAPCKTFAGAISKTAASGEISVLDPGGFGGVTITKAMTISGTGQLSSVLAAGTVGITVNAGPNDVVILRDLSITGVTSATNGINFIGGKELHIEHCSIEGFNTGINVATTVTSVLAVRDSTIQNGSATGVGVSLTSTDVTNKGIFATFDRVKIAGMVTGIMAGDRSKVSLSKSVITGNSTYGLNASPGVNGADVTLDDSTVSNNGTGLRTTAGGNIRISQAVITGNILGLDFSAGGTIVSFLDNRINGNAGGETVSSTVPLR